VSFYGSNNEYAQKIGVDIDNLLLSQPDSGEQALEIVETLVRSGAVDVIVVDSVAALTPRAEIEAIKVKRPTAISISTNVNPFFVLKIFIDRLLILGQ
jgi:RecA/RadA recombinase